MVYIEIVPKWQNWENRVLLDITQMAKFAKFYGQGFVNVHVVA